MNITYIRLIFICIFIVTGINFPVIAKTEIAANIYKIDSIDEISNSHPVKTLYLFDIDDTLFDSKYMLGTKAWRRYIVEATKEDYSRNWHDFFSLFVAQHFPMQTVESHTSAFVKGLQAKDYVVSGLTSRERNKWYETPAEDVDAMTVKQLLSVDIELENGSLKNIYPSLTENSEYYKGVFFANMEPKGNYLKKLLENASSLPEKVIFVDDKLSQVESVAAALEEMGIDHEVYWYCAIESRGVKFDPLIANIQLYYLWISGGKQLMSDDEAFGIAKEHPERDTNYYLQWLLKEISK